MAFRFNPDEPVKRETCRVFDEQIDAMTSALRGDQLDEAVHDARKRCKKLRACIRLLRPSIGKRYKRINGRLRDAARLLADARDSATLVDCFDELLNRHATKLDVAVAAQARSAIECAAVQMASSGMDLAERIVTFESHCDKLRSDIAKLKIDGQGTGPYFDGFELTYRKARAGFKHALTNHDTAALHEWRKDVKYHMYHVRLLRDVWPAMMKLRARELSQLADDLGLDHDLARIAEALAAAGEFADVQAIIATERKGRQSAAVVRGQRLFAETPAAFRRRMKRYWRARKASF